VNPEYPVEEGSYVHMLLRANMLSHSTVKMLKRLYVEPCEIPLLGFGPVYFPLSVLSLSFNVDLFLHSNKHPEEEVEISAFAFFIGAKNASNVCTTIDQPLQRID